MNDGHASCTLSLYQCYICSAQRLGDKQGFLSAIKRLGYRHRDRTRSLSEERLCRLVGLGAFREVGFDSSLRRVEPNPVCVGKEAQIFGHHTEYGKITSSQLLRLRQRYLDIKASRQRCCYVDVCHLLCSFCYSVGAY